jgi:hypothetical protein
MSLTTGHNRVGVQSPGFPIFWLVRYLGAWIFGVCCLGVRNFGFTVFWLAGYLVFQIPGFTIPLASDSSAHLDLQLSVWVFTVGRMVLRFFLGLMARW